MAEMRKIARDQALRSYRFPQFDGENDSYFYPATVSNYVLTLPSRSARGHATLLAKNLQRLVSNMKIESVLFLGETSMPWLYQQKDYKPVRAALDFLAGKRIGKRFNGAIEIYASVLAQYIPHIFWLTRCNAALPDFHFTDVEHNIMGNICKDGNLHIGVFNDKADKWLRDAILTTSFQYTDINQCGTNALNGRRAVV